MIKLQFLKSNNKGALPEQNQFNLSVVDRTELQINDLDLSNKRIKEEKNTARRRLNSNQPKCTDDAYRMVKWYWVKRID